jgi:hypothetical protein
MIRYNLDGEKLCRIAILCSDCPFKLGFHGWKQKPCKKGFFRQNRHNHKRHKDRVVFEGY